MEKLQKGLSCFFIKILKVLNYRVYGISEQKWEYWAAIMLIVFSLGTFILELMILSEVSLMLFILNMIALFKRICELAIENAKLKRNYCQTENYDDSLKSSYTLLLFALVPSTLLLMFIGGLLAIYLYQNSDENGIKIFFCFIVLSNMVINLLMNIFNAIVALYQAQASYGESAE